MSNRFLLLLLLLQLVAVQFTCAQTYQWGHAIGDTASDYANDVFVDDSGYVYLTGAFNGTVDFDPDTSIVYNLIATGDSSAFVLKLDASGDFIWAGAFQATSNPGDFSAGYRVVVDNSGDVIVVGEFRRQVDCNPSLGTSFYEVSAGLGGAIQLMYLL